MVDLVNDLTLDLEMVLLNIKESRMEFQFRLRPTLGTIVQNQADKDLQMNIVFALENGNAEELTFLSTLQAYNITEIQAWFITKYQEWLLLTIPQKDTYHFQLNILFTYVNDIGIKP